MQIPRSGKHLSIRGFALRIGFPISKTCSLQECLHQGKNSLLLGKATEEQEIGPCPGLCILELMRVRNTGAHRHLRVSQEVLHRDGLAGKTAFIELALHELRWRNNQIYFAIRMVEFQEFRFHGGQGALGTGAFHTHILRGMHEMLVQAGITHFSMPVDHSVCGANKNIIMRRIRHRHMMFLQIRCIKNRERQLAMHIVHVDDVRLELLQQRLELALRLKRVDQRGSFLNLLESGNIPHIILFGNEVFTPIGRFVIRVLHGKERDIVTKRA